MLPIGPHAEVIYCRLFKYTQQHTAVLQRTIGPQAEVIYCRLFKYTQQHTAVLQRTIVPHAEVIYCRLFKYIQQHTAVLQRTIVPHAEVIYCRLFKYIQQHTIGYTENNWAPRWSYLVGCSSTHNTLQFYREQLGPTLKLSTVGCSGTYNNTLQFYREQLGPTLELSTVGCSSTHNNTLQFYREQLGLHWSYLLSVVQVHTTIHCSFTENNWAPTEVIYCRLFKYTQQYTAVIQRTIGPPLKLSTVGCSSTYNNTLQFYREQLGPTLELSTAGCSSIHNNTLHVLQGTIGPHAEVIYCRLFKDIQQHTAGFTENNGQHSLNRCRSSINSG